MTDVAYCVADYSSMILF